MKKNTLTNSFGGAETKLGGETLCRCGYCAPDPDKPAPQKKSLPAVRAPARTEASLAMQASLGREGERSSHCIYPSLHAGKYPSST